MFVQVVGVPTSSERPEDRRCLVQVACLAIRPGSSDVTSEDRLLAINV